MTEDFETEQNELTAWQEFVDGEEFLEGEVASLVAAMDVGQTASARDTAAETMIITTGDPAQTPATVITVTPRDTSTTATPVIGVAPATNPLAPQQPTTLSKRSFNEYRRKRDGEKPLQT